MGRNAHASFGDASVTCLSEGKRPSSSALDPMKRGVRVRTMCCSCAWEPSGIPSTRPRRCRGYPEAPTTFRRSSSSHLEHQSVGAERSEDELGDGPHDVTGGDGLGERGGQFTHTQGALNPRLPARTGRRTGATGQTGAGPPRRRPQQGPLGFVRLTGRCREHGQHTDRRICAGQGYGHRAGRLDAQAVSRNAHENTAPLRPGRGPRPDGRADPPTAPCFPGRARSPRPGAVDRRRRRAGAPRHPDRRDMWSPAGGRGPVSPRLARPAPRRLHKARPSPVLLPARRRWGGDTTTAGPIGTNITLSAGYHRSLTRPSPLQRRGPRTHTGASRRANSASCP